MKWPAVKAFVTGGASGLGYAVAERIIDAGGEVAIVDLPVALKKQSLSSATDRCIALSCDVTQDASVDKTLSFALDQFSELNLLVNCAGVLASEKMLSTDHVMPSSDFEKVIAVNLTGTFRVCRAVADRMRDNLDNPSDDDRGVIINTASIAAYEGQIGQLAYSASKGAVASMCLPMARELARYNIRVMTIAPGIFETSMLKDISADVKDKLIQQSIYPKRPGKAEEFAQMVQQIVENPMLNGSVIRLDGGMRMPAK
ncbi:SDR family NAD(P)-dependent oxidoreductase [Beggiatoa alba]|nr:SDR family NAD(P)-dependent oxidoreductase [Beggiatoa alba]